MRKYFEFQNGVKIKCGEDALQTIGSELKYYEATKPLLITSASAQKLGIANKVIAAIKSGNVKEIATLPYESNALKEELVKKIKRLYEEKECDCIIAVGGDAVIDAAKCAKFFLSENCEEIVPLIGAGSAKTKEIPTIVIPTENGSGKEAGSFLEHEDNYLDSIALVPSVVIIDDKTAMAAPARTVAASGIYALANAIESYLNTEEDSPVEIYAEKAVKLLSKYLVKAVENSEDEEACRGVALASTLAGIAYAEIPYGAAHALAAAIAKTTGEPTEEAFAYTLIPAIEKTMQNATERVKNLLLPLAGPTKYAETPDSERAQATISELVKLIETLHEKANVPYKISKTKTPRENFGKIAEEAANNRAAVTAYKPITKETFLAILNAAY